MQNVKENTRGKKLTILTYHYEVGTAKKAIIITYESLKYKEGIG